MHDRSIERHALPGARTYPRRRSGFSLLELVVVVSIMLIGLGLYLAERRPSPHRLIGGTSREIQAALIAGIAQSEAAEGEVAFYVDPTQDTSNVNRYDVRGRFLGISGAAGVDSSSADSSAWIELTQGVQFGVGIATTGPYGEPTNTARIPAEVRCRGHVCFLGGLDYVTYFIGHARDPRAVGAITLTKDGLVQFYHYNPATAVWEQGAQ